MRLRPHDIKSRRALAIGVAVGVAIFGTPPMAAHAALPNCSTITASWSADGTVEIASADELYCIGAGTTVVAPRTTLDLDFRLTAGISLSGFTGDTPWRPIGSSEFPFTGSFDGGGNTITGLNINQPADMELGLFGFIRDASISNVTLASPVVNGGDFIGSLVGEAVNSTISSVTATSVAVTANLDEASVGGLIGSIIHSDVSNVTVSGTVMARGDQTEADREGVGGVIGRIYDDVDSQRPAESAVVRDASFSGSVSGPSTTGGVIGLADTYPTNGTKYLQLINLRSTGSVTSTLDWTRSPAYPWSIGGVIGLVFDANLSEIHSTSNVTSKVPNTGGVIGSLVDSELRGASASGAVSLTTVGTECYVGGLIGAAFSWADRGDPLIIDDVSATGDVSCAEGQDAGGLIGYVDHTRLTNARASGDVTSTGDAAIHAGGLAGAVYASTFTDVSAQGNVTTANDSVGGLIGGAYRYSGVGPDPADVIITRASASGAVTGRTNVGGIVGTGEIYDTPGSIQILSSSSSSSVTGLRSVGGIAGGGDDGVLVDDVREFVPGAGDFVLRDVVSTGSITGWRSSDGGTAPDSAYYGGLVGYLSDAGSIERAYTTSTLTTGVALTNLTIGSMIGVSDGTLTGLSFTSTDPDTLQIAGTLAGSSVNAVYRSLSDLGKLSTYSSWNSPDTVIVDEWVSEPTTQVWGTCATVNSGLPFLQWQRTEACPAAPTPPSPLPNNGGTGGNSASDSGSSQSPSASGSQAIGNDSPVTQTGALPLFRQPAAPQQVTGAVTLVPTSVAEATPTRAMRQEASATLGSAPTVMATANQPVKLMVPGFTPGGTYTVQVKSNNGYVVLGSVEADANGQLQMPVFRMTNGASTTTIAIVSATGEASYVKVKTTKKRGAGERNRTRGAAAGNRR